MLSNSRDGGMVNVIPTYSALFATMARPYKISELNLFFARYALGLYDKSFVGFDTRRIGEAFKTCFLQERFDTLEIIEEAERNKRKEQERLEYEAMVRSLPLGMDAKQYANHTTESMLLAHPHANYIIDTEYKGITKEEILKHEHYDEY